MFDFGGALCRPLLQTSLGHPFHTLPLSNACVLRFLLHFLGDFLVDRDSTRIIMTLLHIPLHVLKFVTLGILGLLHYRCNGAHMYVL